MNNDSRIVQQQIGRELRSDSEVSCRCHLDIPAVIKVPPKLNDGTPFPTTYWLTCPMYSKKIGSLESQGLIKELDKELENNPDLKEKWQSRQKSYQAEREELVADTARNSLDMLIILDSLKQLPGGRIENIPSDTSKFIPSLPMFNSKGMGI